MKMQKKKTEIITARMTPVDKNRIKHLAKKAGMTVTDYIVTCALGKEIVRVDGLDDILTELKAQGRNLNQLTTLANMGRLQLLREDELIDSYTDLCQKLMQLSGEVNGAPTKATHSFCGERRQPGMNELSAYKAGSK